LKIKLKLSPKHDLYIFKPTYNKLITLRTNFKFLHLFSNLLRIYREAEEKMSAVNIMENIGGIQ